MTRREWTRDEQLLALKLYCMLPFGQLHQKNADVKTVAEAINRTPSAVAMKACNFASLDPALIQKGLGNVSRSDRELWNLFQENSEKIAFDAETIYQRLVASYIVDDEYKSEFKKPQGPTESVREVRVRRVQSFFRKSVLISYDNKCALSGLRMPQLIIASHIIPWGVDESRRADPTNGIALNALYDKAFDRGFITFDEDFKAVFSNQLRSEIESNCKTKQLFDFEGKGLSLPTRFQPDMTAMEYHRENIFIQ